MTTQRTAGLRGLLEPFALLRGVAPVASYVTLPAPPKSVDYQQRVKAAMINMALNDQLGDCTIAGIDHVWLWQATLAGLPYTYPGDPAVKSTYLGLTGGKDTGLQLQTVVNAGSTTGLFGHKLLGAGSIAAQDITTLKQTIDIFGSAYCAGVLPNTAETQFENNQPWTLEPGNNPGLDGHCFTLVGYDASWLYACTWGAIQQVSYNWWRRYGTQAYALIGDFYKTAGKGPVANYTLMQSDLHSVTEG